MNPSAPLDRIGRHTLVRELGHGATASVFLARDPFAGREVAIKVLPHASEAPDLMRGARRTSFLNEAALVGRLQHPHIVSLLDAAIEHEYSYVVMEYVPGGTLAQYTVPGSLLALPRAVEVVFKLSRALEYAQRHGVLHRDIKPANVLLTHSFDVKLSDFGLARVTDAPHTEIINAGSPAFISPEQLMEQPVNHQSDIYSLGVLMYQLLTGRLPFHASSTAGLLYQILNHEPPRVRCLRHEVPREVEAIVSRAMQKDPKARYQNWIDFGKDLSRVARHLDTPSEVLSDTKKFHALRDLSFFREFREVEIWETLYFATWKRMREGTVILEEGERSDAFYLLLEGRVAVSRAGVQLATLTAGDLFGEILYFADEVPERSTTVRASEPVLVLEITAAALKLASDACQVQFNKASMRLLIARLSSAHRRIASLESVLASHRPEGLLA